MHEPVMVDEVVALLAPPPNSCCVDATAGRGGHAAALLAALGPDGRLLAIDRDPEAVARLRERFSDDAPRCRVVHGEFADLVTHVREAGWAAVDAIVLDLGVSSDQLDTAERGFSFQSEGPLDMRMNTDNELTAAEIVNTWDEAALARLFRRDGEEPRASRVARAVVSARANAPLTTTLQLAAVVGQAVGGRHGRLHPATRVFQALRMAVNNELAQLEAGLRGGLDSLKPGGRMAVISFHSIEDRCVKHTLARHVARWENLPQGGRRRIGDQPRVQWVTRKGVTPGDAETARNPRARSARLRVVERCEGSVPETGGGGQADSRDGTRSAHRGGHW
jgi:16S rRNA (cytosine1402-N4)-methyltransferase